jgi:hypothetical protein
VACFNVLSKKISKASSYHREPISIQTYFHQKLESAIVQVDLGLQILIHIFNGAKQHDPQFLEEHIKEEHPRLVKRVHPLKPSSVPCITGSGDHFSEYMPLKF